MSIEDIKELYKEEPVKPLQLKDCINWDNNIKTYPQCMEYLSKNNCLEAYEAYPNRFFYDKIKDRLVFVNYSSLNSFDIAIGRALSGQIPKWFKYISLKYYLTECLNSAILPVPTVIVEDCSSACSVARVANSLALCGTSYNLSGLLIALHNVQDVIVSLDPDAKLKSLQLQRDLLGAGRFKSVRILNSDDLKYVADKKILFELIYGATNVNQDKTFPQRPTA